MDGWMDDFLCRSDDASFIHPLRGSREGSEPGGEFGNLTLEHLEPFVGVLLTFFHGFDLKMEIPRVGRFVRIRSFAAVPGSASSSFSGVFEKTGGSQGKFRRLGGGIDIDVGIRLVANFPMDPAEMFGEVFLPREASAAAPFAVWVGALEARFGAAVLTVNFSLMTEQTSGIGEAADFLAAWFLADVGPFMFVFVFAITKFSVMMARYTQNVLGWKINVSGGEELTYIHIFS